MPEVRIPFPTKGVDQHSSYQDQDNQATPHAVNVFADDSVERRVRGGSRPGLSKYYQEALNSRPAFMEVVTTVENEQGEAYQVLVVATEDTIYVGRGERRISGGVYSYDHVIEASSGRMTTEDGDPLVTEGGDYLYTRISKELKSTPRGLTVAYHGELLIASKTGSVNSGDGSITGNVLSYAGTVDWDALGVTGGTYFVEILGHSQGRSVGIQSLSPSSITLKDAIGDNPSISFRVLPILQTFDPIKQTISPVLPTAGFFPTTPTVIAIYRDRLVWVSGRVWYMSRQGDPGDYNYGADSTDAGRAVAAVSSDAGQPGDPIVALAPSGFDYLLMLAEDSVWVLRGDPAYGGQLTNLSRMVGCVGTEAWCYGEDGEIYFLSKSGMYVISPDVSGPPSALSEMTIPLELTTISRDNFIISLAYDARLKSVVILATPRTTGSSQHWIFDLKTASFWQMKFADPGHEPVEAIEFSGAPDLPNRVVMACVDGWIRAISGQDDDGEPIASEIVLGPFVMSEAGANDGMLNSIVGAMDEGSGDVTAEVYVDDTAELCASRASSAIDPDATFFLKKGRYRTMRMRRRGIAFCIRLSSVEQWSFELLTGTIESGGYRRF